MNRSRFQLVSAAIITALGFSLAGAGCPGTTAPEIDGPMVVNGEVVFLNRANSQLVIVDPAQATVVNRVTVQQFPLAVGILKNAVLISGGPGADPVAELVAVPGGAVHKLSVPGAYENMATSPDGAFAILYFDPSATPTPGSPAAQNNNQITVVNVGAQSQTTLSLNTASLAPESVVFSPDHDTAAVVMDGTIVLLQLADPSVQEQVPLTLPDGTILHPEQAVFSPDGAYLYVRTTGDDDVITLSVTSTPGAISTAVNFLIYPSATGLVDITVPGGSGFNRYVAALYSSGTAALLDATGDTSRTHILNATGSSLVDLGNGMLIVTSEEANSFVGWEPLLDRSTSGTLPAMTSGLPMTSEGRALFVYPAVTSGAGQQAQLTTASLTDDGAQLRLHENPITLDGQPSAQAIDKATGTVFFSLPTSDPKKSAIVSLDPTTLAIGGFTANDSPFQWVDVVGSFVYGYHSDTHDIAFFPVSNPTSARNVRNLF